jgi:Flp pilus assembly protein TadD
MNPQTSARAENTSYRTSHSRAPRKSRRIKSVERTEAHTLERAVDNLQRTISEAMKDANAWFVLGASLERLGRLESSLRAFETASSLDPENMEIVSARAVVLSRAGRHGEAAQLFAEVVDKRGGSAESFLNLGVALRKDARHDEAILCFHKVLELNPGEARAHLELGLAHLARAAIEEAIVALRAACALAPSWPVSEYYLGLALHRATRVDEAITALGRAAKLAPTDETIREALNTFLEEKKETDRRRSPTACEPALAGDLARFPIPDLIEFMAQQRARGKLEVRSGDARLSISLWDGTIIGASPAESSEEDPDHLAPFLLIDEGRLDPKTLAETINPRIETALSDVVAMKQGRFFFAPFSAIDDPPQSIAEVAIDARFAVFEALRKLDEQHAEAPAES